MVQINGTKEFAVYDLDTQQSAILRLANSMNTIPRYLYFPDGLPSMNDFYSVDGDIQVENLLTTIINPKAGLAFNPIFLKLKDKIGQQGLNMRTDVLLPFIAFNKSIATTPEDFRGAILLSMETEINDAKIFEQSVSVEQIWDDRKKIITDIKDGVSATKKKAEEQTIQFKKFDKIKAQIKYTVFELDSVNFEFTLDIVHISLMELFNQLQLNSTVPMASINNMFKILKDFVPPQDWGVSVEDAILVKVLQKSDVSGFKITDYTDTIVAITGEPGEENVSVGMSLKTSGQYLKRDKLIDRFLGVIKGMGEIDIKSIQETKVNGVFYFPQHTIDKYVFADIVMNNPLFSTMMSIDESEKATKKKESVYIHFHHPKVGNLTANITAKIAVKGDHDLRGKDILGDFSIGSSYIRVKISSADNLQAVAGFQGMMSKLFVIYDQEYDNIVSFYRKFIPDFAKGTGPKPIPETKLKLKDIAPEVFVIGYPRKCTSPPEIVDDEEAEIMQNEGKRVMKYPLHDEPGFPSRNYICDSPDAPYPGLRENPLSNRDLVPFLPCCYNKDHESRPGTIYRYYYYGEERREKADGDQQDLIITDKFLTKDNYGILPEDMVKLFNSIDYTEGYKYVRKGVNNTKSSFLECVLEGMYEETDILDFSEREERLARLYQFRDALGSPERAALCRQEMYDFDISQIQEIIGDKDVYLDPKLFTSLLEEVFNCNIYVFSRLNTSTAQLTLPRHLQAYYKKRRETKSIFIYEHTGSVSDHAEYPRCELIIKWRVQGGEEEDISYYFNYMSKVSRGVKNIYDHLKKAYALNLEIFDTVLPIENKAVKLLEQGIDSYGKCRMIRFMYEKTMCTLLTSPIPPLGLPEVKGWTVTKVRLNLARKFVDLLDIPITSQTVSDGKLKEIQGMLGNVTIALPIIDANPLTGVPEVDKGVSYPENRLSTIETYNRYKKLARYITEYLYWLFSKYLNEDESRPMDFTTIQEFFDLKVEVDPNFEYGDVGKTFSMTGGVMRDGHLILQSEETLKRLVYVLRVYMRRFRQKLTNYHSRKVIENYYVDITDFDQYQFQVILQGEQSIEKWIQESKLKYSLHKAVYPEYLLPYFFQNNLIGPDIYLAQNTSTLQKAIRIAETWKMSGYNMGNDPDVIAPQMVAFTLYSYTNENDIIMHKVTGIPLSYEIKLLGYKMGKDVFYTVLLPL